MRTNAGVPEGKFAELEEKASREAQRQHSYGAMAWDEAFKVWTRRSRYPYNELLCRCYEVKLPTPSRSWHRSSTISCSMFGMLTAVFSTAYYG